MALVLIMAILVVIIMSSPFWVAVFWGDISRVFNIQGEAPVAGAAIGAFVFLLILAKIRW